MTSRNIHRDVILGIRTWTMYSANCTAAGYTGSAGKTQRRLAMGWWFSIFLVVYIFTDLSGRQLGRQPQVFCCCDVREWEERKKVRKEEKRTIIYQKMGKYRMGHGFRLSKRADYDHFEVSIIFWGRWGSSKNWLKPNTEPP